MHDSEIDQSENMHRQLEGLTNLHYANCLEYRTWIDAGVFPNWSNEEFFRLPYLPVRAFKEFKLLSVNENLIIQELNSSGTGGTPSKIYLDQETSKAQQAAIRNSLIPFLGENRLPYLVFDVDPRKNRAQAYSARLAATLGFGTLGKSATFILNEDLSIDLTALNSFIDKFGEDKIFAFGFTSVIWETIRKNPNLASKPLSKGFLLHGGGWKKMESISVSREIFNQKVKEIFGFETVKNYYGMIEQPGSIFLEDNEGWLSPTEYSQARIRRTSDLKPAKEGEPGVVQVFSTLPKSYPGHSLLTEDEGFFSISEGKYRIKVTGRLPHAELRGCSDV
jgi:hypothetical protein